ncbi:hypothetical protein TRFO_27876 [Tritrichomonas foetus]|uniref:Uncharacterized protein n=1 Tax=Tritrichomonas foetus TaxID=1144522 RepID=A0A1J4JZM2_9EUKA|nr:hypothetical protein TRFO_27876 [Tritrichomonas foetus]|eukprot:OHT04609.1 hypothetical protein TRFO_27876 [Tritrichomonas foetus]
MIAPLLFAILHHYDYIIKDFFHHFFFCDLKTNFEHRVVKIPFRTEVQKQMLHFTTTEHLNYFAANIMFRIIVTIKTASKYNNAVQKLLEIGLVCDRQNIAFHSKLLPKCFGISELVFFKNLSRDNVTVENFDENPISDYFQQLIHDQIDAFEHWKFFKIPVTKDGHSLFTLLKRTQHCTIPSLFLNIERSQKSTFRSFLSNNIVYFTPLKPDDINNVNDNNVDENSNHENENNDENNNENSDNDSRPPSPSTANQPIDGSCFFDLSNLLNYHEDDQNVKKILSQKNMANKNNVETQAETQKDEVGQISDNETESDNLNNEEEEKNYEDETTRMVFSYFKNEKIRNFRLKDSQKLTMQTQFNNSLFFRIKLDEKDEEFVGKLEKVTPLLPTLAILHDFNPNI